VKKLPDIRLDGDAERMRRSIVDAISDLQIAPFAQAEVIQDVELADATTTHVSHGLGRKPRMVIVSPPRNATSTGRIVESRDSVDRTRSIKLTATGHGATITVDVVLL
jgi:hypothetical protein